MNDFDVVWSFAFGETGLRESGANRAPACTAGQFSLKGCIESSRS